jgi:hypothetical protein
VVETTAPPLGDKNKLLPKPLPEEKEISKFEGAFISILVVRLLPDTVKPDTVKLCEPEGVPTVAEKGFKLAKKEIVGVPELVDDPSTSTFLDIALGLNKRTLPLWELAIVGLYLT